MKRRTNISFAEQWSAFGVSDVGGVTLHPRLAELINAPLVRTENSLVLEGLWKHSNTRADFEDDTAFEAFKTAFHVEDILSQADEERPSAEEVVVQSVKAASVLADRLAPLGHYRVFLSLDASVPTSSIRFFALRPGETWGGDDPDEFTLEAVLMIDT